MQVPQIDEERTSVGFLDAIFHDSHLVSVSFIGDGSEFWFLLGVA